jgi:putative ATP-dependent endonuclease of the OLD family
MRLSQVRLSGFRNLDRSVRFDTPLCLVVGENNAGKTNLIDALRLLLLPADPSTQRLYPQPVDFTHDGTGAGRGDQFEIEAVFTGLTQPQLGRMAQCLAPSVAPDAVKLTMVARLEEDGRVYRHWAGGDGGAGIEDYARGVTTYTYLRPLRDAAADLRPGRTHRLAPLLQSIIAGSPNDDGTLIEKIVADSNTALSAVPSIIAAKDAIQAGVNQIVGDGYAQQVDLAFAEPLLPRIIANLRALAGDQHPLELAENGLGFNNVLYIATVLAGLARQPDDGLHMLLIEEPEAHLHPQLQDLLIQYLDSQTSDRVQAIVTTHSPNLTSGVGVERIVLLARLRPLAPVAGYTLASFGLTADELGHLRRFLDVTKASLLFARGVLLVEGVAEQLMFPWLAAKLGLSLPRAGITVVNVGGLAFGPFAQLFSPDRLPCRCAIISDGDPPPVLSTAPRTWPTRRYRPRHGGFATSRTLAGASFWRSRPSSGTWLRPATGTPHCSPSHRSSPGPPSGSVVITATRRRTCKHTNYSRPSSPSRAPSHKNSPRSSRAGLRSSSRHTSLTRCVGSRTRPRNTPAAPPPRRPMLTPDPVATTTARKRVAAVLANEDYVSPDQRAVARHPGNFMLEACPGSGKTRTIGLRVAWATVDGSGRTIAALSFTNVAVAEIHHAAAMAGASIAEPNFVSTLHRSFFRYVLYPYGHLVMGCSNPPRIVGELAWSSDDVVPIARMGSIPDLEVPVRRQRASGSARPGRSTESGAQRCRSGRGLAVGSPPAQARGRRSRDRQPR